MGFVVIGAVLAYLAAGIVFWMGAGWLLAITTLLTVGTASAIAIALTMRASAERQSFQRDGGYDDTRMGAPARRTVN